MDLIIYEINSAEDKIKKLTPIVGNYTFSCSTGKKNFSSNDFELKMPYTMGNKLYGKNNCVSWGNTEFGGFIKQREVDTDKGEVTYRGTSWRGFWSRNFIDVINTSISGNIQTHFQKFLKWLGALANYTTLIVETDNTTEKSAVYEALSPILNCFDKVCENFSSTFNIQIYNGKLNFLLKPIATHNFDASQTKLIYEENWERANLVFAVNPELGIGAAAYLQEDGSIGPDRFYREFESVEKVVKSSATTVSELEKQAVDALAKEQEFVASEIFTEIENAEVGDEVIASILEIGLKITKRVVEKSIKITNGNSEITYTLEG